MFENTSLFGYQGDPASCAAYDMCIIEDERKRAEENNNTEGEKVWGWLK